MNSIVEPHPSIVPAEPAPGPRLPHVALTPSGLSPEAPHSLADMGLEISVLTDLALKLTATVSSITTEWAGEKLCLPPHLMELVFLQLKQDRFVEVLGKSGPFDYRYTATDRGREHARRLVEISAYVGPAPVSLDAYTEFLDWQTANRPRPTLQQVHEALSPLVISPSAVEVAALAALSGRSLLVFGPSGNGKTTLAQLLHNVILGDIWIPYCINVESSIIRIFDPHLHVRSDAPAVDADQLIDRRWVRIRPPFVVAGGEMTIAELDLAYSPAHRFYEAPPHLKANGGTFLIDDFGRQRMEPHELLNRWIVPLERQVDYLTLCTGQKIEVPFRLMLLVATNLQVAQVADPAFLRRAGYRLFLDKPAPDAWESIFTRYARSIGLEPEPSLGRYLLARYAAERRELRASEACDLIERAREICRLHQRPSTLDAETLNTAWHAYFSQS